MDNPDFESLDIPVSVIQKLSFWAMPLQDGSENPRIPGNSIPALVTGKLMMSTGLQGFLRRWVMVPRGKPVDSRTISSVGILNSRFP